MMSKLSQAAENNKGPIGVVLVDAFSRCQKVLEIGSGTGQHAMHMGALLPNTMWLTSDLQENQAAIRARLEAGAGDNVAMPMVLDVAQEDWPVSKIDGIFSANAVHIMSWAHVESMFAGIGKILNPGGILALYGPYKYGGKFTTESNERFDGWLKDRDAVSGIRDFEKVDALAGAIGLRLLADHQMPANNQLLVWRRD